ncbi:putative glycerate kinase [Gordonia paraffinivorans NBRC 108238]|uniref:Glycerate kinase n=2 Tax=Gordonia paraffinivorans TaxID=175628 RepID=A0ABQ0ILL1_9ACTN|nr:glycerate kinase [Gordonia paraffinivorans]GAC84433.1 putative glycerate kinase [Gordonia paraffinivorans NBRC 108238]VFA82923.1 Glycerate kinase [Gordonia paraffinivorans]
MHVLIAPDSFGDTMSAVAAAQAIARGWGSARPSDVLVTAPQSDGGPGFVDVLASRFGTVVTEDVHGPLGAGVTARWLHDADSATAYVECAQACGLHQLGGRPTPRTAVSATTHGVGELVRAAVAAGARRLVVGLGGSATTDGGAGLVDALGGPEAAARLVRDVEIVVASDVENPLLGPLGAAAVFGPQKGADPDTVELLERRLAEWASVLSGIAGRDITGDAGAGAAGGLGAALIALGGTRVSGATVVAEATGLEAEVAASDLVVTGEGKFDSQTLRGKVVSALHSLAKTVGAGGAGATTLVLAGQVTLTPEEIAAAGIAGAHAIVDVAGSVEVAMKDAENQLGRLAAGVAASMGD